VASFFGVLLTIHLPLHSKVCTVDPEPPECWRTGPARYHEAPFLSMREGASSEQPCRITQPYGQTVQKRACERFATPASLILLGAMFAFRTA
jgi:hypothetical protein